MKILVLNFNIKGVGTYRRSFYFSRELARAGHTVTMVTVSRDSKYKPRMYYKRNWVGECDKVAGQGPWVRIIEGPALGHKWLPGWGSGPLDIALRIKEIMRGHYDIVYGFEYHPDVSWPVYLTRPLMHYRFLSDWCDWFAGSSNQFRGCKLAHQVDKILEEGIRTFADRVSVTSRVLWERAASLGISSDRICHIPAAAASDYIQPFPKEPVRAKFNLPQNAPIILSVRSGNMHKEVMIFSQVLKQLPGAYYLMLGRPSISALEMAKELGISERILSTGWVSDENYPEYLACADVCFCPLEDGLNDRARWPAKILDFLTAGRATVTNGVGEVKTLFEQHEIGLLTGFTPAAFAEGIVSLMHDKERRNFLEGNARRLMEGEWDYKERGKLIVKFVEG
jgi:glycosyltransferase involved in cell wall biosynthesis